MQCPTGEISSFFYKSKLNCLSFTIVEMLEKPETVYKKKRVYLGHTVMCIAIFGMKCRDTEELTKLGPVFYYLHLLNEQNLNKYIHVTFYSHNCCSQNKNKFIMVLYSYAVSLIEKEIKRKKRSGPISAPYQYVTLIKNARKNGKPFIVKKLTYDFFVDLKLLQEKWGYNFSEDEDKNSVILNNIKVLKFMKTDSFSFYYKISYSQSEFKRVNIRNKRKKMMSPEEIVLTKAFSQRLELSEHKKKDLRDLINKNLIPSYYRDFYASIL
ncbi:unnamed protein product [Euphydryas editha]|uniref:Uncharacterized protein n=1 Tax=Euphydryas editha TaxID=104508 RepID=A0AAU9V4W6_EUPED|nr:unnamed protein product [Euphydryas editha]